MESFSVRVLLFVAFSVAFASALRAQRKTTTTPAPIVEAESEEQAMPMDMILNHCPVLCSPDLKSNHPLRHLVPSYALYGSCMDDCICAAYCYMVDSNGQQQQATEGKDSSNYDSCFVRCSTEVKPFTNDASNQ